MNKEQATEILIKITEALKVVTTANEQNSARIPTLEEKIIKLEKDLKEKKDIIESKVVTERLWNRVSRSFSLTVCEACDGVGEEDFHIHEGDYEHFFCEKCNGQGYIKKV